MSPSRKKELAKKLASVLLRMPVSGVRDITMWPSRYEVLEILIEWIDKGTLIKHGFNVKISSDMNRFKKIPVEQELPFEDSEDMKEIIKESGYVGT